MKNLCGIFCVVLAVISTVASATEGAKYVVLRQKLHYDRSLSYSAVQSNPLAYTKRILEIRGTVSERVGGAEGMMIMLTLPDKNEVSLDVPSEEMPYLLRFNKTPALRVLVEVQEAGISNSAPLKVLALSYESEVSAIEKLSLSPEGKRKVADIERKRTALLLHIRSKLIKGIEIEENQTLNRLGMPVG